MLLDPATPKNVSRAIEEINAFEWEGDFKPMARRALKELLEYSLDQEMTHSIWECLATSVEPTGTIIGMVTMSGTC